MIAPDLWAVGAPAAPDAGSSNAPISATAAAKLPIRDFLPIDLPPYSPVPITRATLAPGKSALSIRPGASFGNSGASSPSFWPPPREPKSASSREDSWSASSRRPVVSGM